MVKGNKANQIKAVNKILMKIPIFIIELFLACLIREMKFILQTVINTNWLSLNLLVSPKYGSNPNNIDHSDKEN